MLYAVSASEQCACTFGCRSLEWENGIDESRVYFDLSLSLPAHRR